MDSNHFIIKQSQFAVLGIIGALVLSLIDYRLWRRFIIPIWFGCTFLLVCCYIPGIGMRINGELRWINLGFMSFQPSEVAKISLMLCMAHWYTSYRQQAGSIFTGIIKPGIIFGIPLMLILFEKDMGTTAALGLSGLCLMFVAGTRWWVLLLIIIIGALFFYLFTISSPNRLARIEAWDDPEGFAQHAGRQQWIAILSFARGSFVGIGLGDSIYKYGSLPFAHTDFIYATIGEELGFIGSASVLLLFLSIALASINLALKLSDYFGRLLCIGLMCTIFWPAMLNIMVVTSLLPNSGLPLPFISYGGTNLVFTIAAIGIITSIQRHDIPTKKSCWPLRRRAKITD